MSSLTFRAVAVPFALLTMNAFAADPASSAPPAPLGSAVFIRAELPVQPSGVGERRDIARRPTATMQEFECHLSTLNAGLPSHPPHQHPQEELIILQEGTLEVFINGQTARIGPGSLFFFASYDWHAVRNVGPVPARYSVFNFSTGLTRQVAARPAAETASPDKLRSQVFAWDSLTAVPTKTGERRGVFDAPTVTCSRLECHATTLKAGLAPHAAHHHPDEEVVLVREGTVEVTIQGTPHRLGPGDIAFFASNEEHGLKNVGTDTASYYIIRVITEATPKPTKI